MECELMSARSVSVKYFVNCGLTVPGRVVLLNYREDGITPFVTVWKHGVKEEKV